MVQDHREEGVQAVAARVLGREQRSVDRQTVGRDLVLLLDDARDDVCRGDSDQAVPLQQVDVIVELLQRVSGSD
jgi:hypothetical protein